MIGCVIMYNNYFGATALLSCTEYEGFVQYTIERQTAAPRIVVSTINCSIRITRVGYPGYPLLPCH